MPSKPKKAPLAERMAAASRPTEAWGLAHAPNGLGVSAAVDAFFGLGFPYCVWAVEEPFVKPASWKAFSKASANETFMTREAMALEYALRGAVQDEAGLAAAYAAAPAMPALETGVAYELACGFGWRGLLLLEGFYGTRAVADAFVSELSRLAAASTAQWGAALDRSGWAQLRALGWMLHRVPAQDRERHRASLGAILDAQRAQGPTLWRAAKAIDLVLNGKAGVERSGRNNNGVLDPEDLPFAHDDPAWVTHTMLEILEKLRPADRHHFVAQVCVVGGPRLVEAHRDAVARFPKENQPRMVELLQLFV